MNDLIYRQDAIDAIDNESRVTDNKMDLSGLYLAKSMIETLPSADRQDDNRLYIKIYADDEPSRKAEKLYQICGETENQEVAQWLKEYFSSADRSTGWIPVSERLPKEYAQYLAYFKNGECYVYWLEDSEWSRSIIELEEIVAWMPLPPPYDGV